jgi:DNA (cytosine-5)-methyltransferase 1
LIINAISLFSGIGAFELAASLVFGETYQTFQFVEIDYHAQHILLRHFPNIPIWSDIRSYHPPKPGQIGFPTVVLGGFPCLGTSNAGKRQGLAHPESNLWYSMLRIICEFQPEFVVVENPEGVIHRGLREILAGLTMAGYQTEVELISAAELGAPHRRSRIFIVAHANHLCLQQRQGWCSWFEQIGEHIAIARSLIHYPQTQPSSLCLDDGFPGWLDGINFDGWWKQNSPPLESGIKPRTPGRREAINLYGRSIVPLQAAIALMRLKFLSLLI